MAWIDYRKIKDIGPQSWIIYIWRNPKIPQENYEILESRTNSTSKKSLALGKSREVSSKEMRYHHSYLL